MSKQPFKAPFEGAMDKLANNFTGAMISSNASDSMFQNEIQKQVTNPIPHIVPLVPEDGDQSPMRGNKAQQLRNKCNDMILIARE